MSRLQKLMDLLGGPENLPPKLPDPPTRDIETVEEEEQPPPIVRDPNYKPPRQILPQLINKASLPPAARAPAPAMLTSDDDNDTRFAFESCKGKPAPLGIKFAPFLAVTKYCYKFAPGKWLQPLASAFFDANKIWSRPFDLYYVHSDFSGVIAFVAEHQLQSLIDDINAQFPEAQLSITDDNRECGLVIDFEDLPQELRPRQLGRTTSRSQYESWVRQLQAEPAMVLPDNGDRSIEAYKAKMSAAADANRAKNKAAKAKRHQQTLIRRHGMVKEGLRAQRYLGLLPKREDSLLPEIANLSISPILTTAPPPHAFDNEPIFISIDVEAWERPPRMVTEIGVATLDTRDLKNVAPGRVGEEWHKHIRGRHFRIIEYKNYVNHDFVQGCPDQFEFGHSEFIGKDSIGSNLASCFKPPFSGKHFVAKEGDFPALGAASANGAPEVRNIVLVGHDLGQDINYCQQVGFSVLSRGNILDTIDTVNLYRTHTKDPSARSLGSILADSDLTGWHLHNAGNDAVYTLQAMLAICVTSATKRTDPAEPASDSKEEMEKRTEAAVETARERAKEDAEGWDCPQGEDGGVALRPQEADFLPKAKNDRAGGRGQQNDL